MNPESILHPNCIKNCSVVLERLDDKLLLKYLEKYNTTKGVDFLKHNSKKNRRKLTKSTGKNWEFKRRKKNKLSCDYVSPDETENTTKLIDERNTNQVDIQDEVQVKQEVKTEYIVEKYDVEEEDDEREDNEDDRMTVIFEESPTKKDSSFEIAEKPPDTENYLKILSELIKRLHELFRIISQLQNDKHVVYYSKSIKPQMISLLKEIKMIQKPVIECYERLLTYYENSTEVITKVSQNGLLRLEDVSNIISRCLLMGKFQKNESAVKKVTKGYQTAYCFQPNENVSYQYEIISNADIIPEKLDPFYDYIQKPQLNRYLSAVPDYPQPFCLQQFYIQQKSGIEEFNFGSPVQNKSEFYHQQRFLPKLHPLKPSKQFSNVQNEVKNPTVPGYLQVKNHQSRSVAKKETEISNNIEVSNVLKKESSNYRIYVCAHNNCKMPGILICKDCQSVIYCSETCQLKHWALKHKTECYQLRELRIACKSQ